MKVCCCFSSSSFFVVVVVAFVFVLLIENNVVQAQDLNLTTTTTTTGSSITDSPSSPSSSSSSGAGGQEGETSTTCTCQPDQASTTQAPSSPGSSGLGSVDNIVIERRECNPNDIETCRANCFNIHGIDEYLKDKCCKHIGQSASLLAFEIDSKWVPRIEEFNKCTGATVRLEYLKEGEDGMSNAIRNDLGDDIDHELAGSNQNKGQGIFDAYIVQAPWLPPVINGLENLTPLIRQNANTVQFLDINEASRSAVSYNGTVRALPLDTDYISLGWRQDIFYKYSIPSELSPPKTIEDLVHVAQMLNGKDFNNDSIGDWGICLTPQVNYFYSFVAPIIQSSLRDKNGNPTGQNIFFDSNTFQPLFIKYDKAFQYALELYYSIILVSNCQEQLSNGEKCDRKTAFPTGRCAMVISMPGTLTNMLLPNGKYSPKVRYSEITGEVEWDINNETLSDSDDDDSEVEEHYYWGRRAPFPGSTIVQSWTKDEQEDGTTYPLVECKDNPIKYCPVGEYDEIEDRIINYSPFFSEGGEAYAINGRQSKPIARTIMWDMFTWLSELPVTELPLSGQYRKSHLQEEQKLDLIQRGGWKQTMVNDLFDVLNRYFKSEDEGGNPVQDLLMLGFPEYMDALDDELHDKLLGVKKDSIPGGGLFDRSDVTKSITSTNNPEMFQQAYNEFINALEERYNIISNTISGGQIGQLQRWRQSLNLPWRSNDELCVNALLLSNDDNSDDDAFRRLQCPSIVNDLESLCRLYPKEFQYQEEDYCSSFFITTNENSNNNLAVILPSILVPLIIILCLVSYLIYIDRKRKKADELWIVNKDDLNFGTEHRLIGKGSFGVVYLAEYRGTKVAVKQVLPPVNQQKKKKQKINNKTTTHPRDMTLLTTSQEDIVETSRKGGKDEEEGGDIIFEPGLLSVSKRNSTIPTGNQSSMMSSTYGSTMRRWGVGGGGRNGSGSWLPRRGFFYTSDSIGSRSGGGGGGGGGFVGGHYHNNARFRKRKADFVTEMRHLAKLRHPNITTTMGAVLSRGEEPMMVMEYMEHGSLYDAMRNETINLNSKEDILTIVQDIAHGLRFLHSANPAVIHGDLKSKNILIDSSFRAKIADFGLSAKNKAGARGTPYWMAPELLMRLSSNTTMSDIYAFGITLYEVYSRENPYKGEDYKDVIRDVPDPAVCKRPPVPSSCPTKIATLMQDCWQHNPDDRLSAEEVDSLLQAEGTIQGRVVRIEELNRQLLDQNEQISTEQAKQLGHFACMSHEIRTPLNCVIGISSLLEDDRNLDPSQKDSVKMIVSSGKLLRQVVDDVLDFSKFISGNAEIDVRRTDLQETLATIISSMALFPATEKNNITIQTFYSPLVPQYIETDGRRLQQIMYNLFSNAIKFSKMNGRVDLSVSVGSRYQSTTDEEKKEASLGSNERHSLRLRVKDYGQGIDKSEFDKLFEPFQQTESGKAHGKGGTGLGLPIVKQLVELLGGSISVDSKVGEWTEFSLQFPLSVPLVDTRMVESQLTNCWMWLVSNKESETKYMLNVCEHFNVRLRHFGSMEELETEFESSGKGRSCACLIQDDLYDESVFDRLSQKAQANKTLLVTFGHDGKIGRAQAHFQSLTQLFPSVLMQELGSLCNAKTPARSLASKQETICQVEYQELKILVAEDNLVNQKVVTRMLDRLGASNVQLADNGQIAVDLEATNTYDIVFMDMQMPVMDGIEACKRIVARAEAETPPKVVFLSANVLDDHEALCKETGATDYLTKPCTLVDMRKMLEKLTNDM